MLTSLRLPLFWDTSFAKRATMDWLLIAFLWQAVKNLLMLMKTASNPVGTEEENRLFLINEKPENPS